MSTGKCGISLDRDSVSKEFQSRVIVLRKMNTYISTGGEWYRRDQDRNDEPALKVGPNDQCLQQLVSGVARIWCDEGHETNRK